MNFTAWASSQPNNYPSLFGGEGCIRSVLPGEERDGEERDGEEREGTWDDHRCWLRDAKALVCKLELE